MNVPQSYNENITPDGNIYNSRKVQNEEQIKDYKFESNSRSNFKDLSNELISNNNTALNDISQNKDNSNNPFNINIYGKNKNKEKEDNLFDLKEESSSLRNKGNGNVSSDKDNYKNYIEKEEFKLSNKEEIEKEEEKKDKSEIYTTGEKIRSKIMERINRGRAKFSDNKSQNDTKSQNILMKAKLLEKVLGNMKKPEDLNNNYITNQRNINENIQNESNLSIQNQLEKIPLVKKKKMEKKIISFE